MRSYVFCLLVFSTPLAPPTSAARAEDPIIASSVVSAGNTARLQHALSKGRRGEPVTVAVIGGSITAGAGATSREKNYGSLLTQWWREAFPQAKIELVNAGIGATGSNYGALRAQRDLLDRRPDFVVVEYGVNDPNTRSSAETLEGLVRQILKQPQQPAVVLLFIEGRVVLVMDWRIRGPMGKARVQVDDRPGEVRDAWFDQTWGGFRETNELARDLSPGTHRVVFEILAERNPQSTGHEYRILGLGVAGR